MGALNYLTGDSSLLYMCEELSNEYFNYLKKKNKTLTLNRWSERVKEYTRCYNTYVVVCVDSSNNYPIGHCITCLYDRGKRGIIEELFVRDYLRTKGIGSTLMNFSLIWLADQYIKTPEMNVKYGNESVLKFCNKFDFIPTDYKLVRK